MNARSSHRRCSIKKMFLKNSQNSQENTCARVSFLNKVAGLRRFPLNFANFLRIPFLQNTSERLLLECWKKMINLQIFYSKFSSKWKSGFLSNQANTTIMLNIELDWSIQILINLTWFLVSGFLMWKMRVYKF